MTIEQAIGEIDMELAQAKDKTPNFEDIVKRYKLGSAAYEAISDYQKGMERIGRDWENKMNEATKKVIYSKETLRLKAAKYGALVGAGLGLLCLFNHEGPMPLVYLTGVCAGLGALLGDTDDFSMNSNRNQEKRSRPERSRIEAEYMAKWEVYRSQLKDTLAEQIRV